MLDVGKYLGQVSENFLNLQAHTSLIEATADVIIQSLRAGGKVIFCGNGGSSADAQHLAAELLGRFKIDRRPLAALSLTVDTSTMTAIANDYGYEEVFSRQLQGLGRAGDVLVAISTSGNSENVLRAVEWASPNAIHSIGLTGGTGGRLKDIADQCIIVPTHETSHIQEMHIAVGHAICAMIETALCQERSSARTTVSDPRQGVIWSSK